MSVLSGQELSKAYGERVLLDRVSVTIADGERVGVVGRNGAGKSTLAKLLAGAEPADGGTIAVRRGARVAYLAQEPVLDATRTVRDVVEEGLAASFVARKRHEELSQQIAAGAGNVDALVAEQHDVAAEIERLGGWDRTHEVERVLDKLGVGDFIDRATGQLSG
jgi:ATP-binding cassette subfamily F protein uup